MQGTRKFSFIPWSPRVTELATDSNNILQKYKAKKKNQTNPFISFLATILVYSLWLEYRISLFILIPLTLALVFDGWRKSRWNKPFSKYHLCLSAWWDSLFDFLFDFFFLLCQPGFKNTATIWPSFKWSTHAFKLQISTSCTGLFD